MITPVKMSFQFHKSSFLVTDRMFSNDENN